MGTQIQVKDWSISLCNIICHVYIMCESDGKYILFPITIILTRTTGILMDENTITRRYNNWPRFWNIKNFLPGIQ